MNGLAMDDYTKSVLTEVGRLKTVRGKPEFPLFGRPRHEQHKDCVDRIAILAAHNPKDFARLVAEGVIEAEFESFLCRARSLHSSGYFFGVLPILRNSNIPEVVYCVNWYMRVHYSDNLDVHEQETTITA